MINTARKSPKSSKVAEPTGALAEIANCSCQADPFADPFAQADPFAPFAKSPTARVRLTRSPSVSG
jgi:hypothetical protein